MSRRIVVVGGGPGGYTAAVRAAALGGDVTLVEKEKIGGTCLNYGCIPTKLLHRHADVAGTIRKAETYGIRTGGCEIDFEKIAIRRDRVVDQLRSGVNGIL